MQNNDTSNISINIKKHIKHGQHRAKFTFTDDPVSLKTKTNQKPSFKIFIYFKHVYKLQTCSTIKLCKYL